MYHNLNQTGIESESSIIENLNENNGRVFENSIISAESNVEHHNEH